MARALGSAPLANNCSTTSLLPERAAVITSVSPDTSLALGFAPACNSVFTIFALAFSQAIHNGVAPRSLDAFTFAPARINNSAAGMSSW